MGESTVAATNFPCTLCPPVLSLLRTWPDTGPGSSKTVQQSDNNRTPPPHTHTLCLENNREVHRDTKAHPPTPHPIGQKCLGEGLV